MGGDVGMFFEICNVKYSSNSIEFALKGIEATTKEDAEKAEFKKYCRRYGFSEDMYGLEFTDSDSRRVRFVGFIPTNRKYSCIIQDIVSKKKLCCSVEYVQAKLLANLINDEASDPYVKCKKCKYCNIDTGRDGSICYECYLGQEYYAGLAKDDSEWKKLLSDPLYKPYCSYKEGIPTSSHSGND